MSIFKSLTKPERKKNSTLGFYFGHTEAEGENKEGPQNLENFFEDYLHVLNQLEDERFIFVGRKGSGKSAIAKFIQDTSDGSENSFASIIRLIELRPEALIQAIPKDEVEDTEAVLFEWIILVRLIKLFVKNEQARYSKHFSKLETFLKRNTGVVEIDKFFVQEVIEKKKLEARVEVLKHAFAGYEKFFDTKTVKAPFYRLIPLLKEIVQEVLAYEVYKDKEYWILFDDLDINFKSDDPSSCNNLVKLLRIAKLFNTSILVRSKARVLVFLREDARKIIETFQTDTAKIFSSYANELNWYSHDMFKLDENKTNLKRFINKRLALNFEKHKVSHSEEDPWESLFEEDLSSFNGKTSFKYVLDFSFYRPRDLILFLNPVGKEDFTFPIKPSSVKVLVKRFVKENIQELKSELNIYLSPKEVEDLFQRLLMITRKPNAISKEDAIKLFKGVSANIGALELIRILLEYSILILIDSDGKVHINYREGDQSSNLDRMKISVHKCVYTYFNPETV